MVHTDGPGTLEQVPGQIYCWPPLPTTGPLRFRTAEPLPAGWQSAFRGKSQARGHSHGSRMVSSDGALKV